MLKRFNWLLLFIIIISALGWNIAQWQLMNKGMLSLDAKIDKITPVGGETQTAQVGQKGYEVTIDMWQIFEKELQDYKQRLREGKQQYTDQQSSWNTLLSELKKTLQDQDKFIAAEGDFWEKQLKNYDKMLAKAEERFDVLNQVIEELKGIRTDFSNWLATKEAELKERETEAVAPETEVEKPTGAGQQITPSIKGGGGEYKTYPFKEEEQKPEGEKKEEGVIRGTVTGSGDYKTY